MLKWGECETCYATSTNCNWGYIRRWNGKGSLSPYEPKGGLIAAVEAGLTEPVEGVHLPPSWMTAAVMPSLTNEALIDLKNRKVNLAITIAERQKTADMVVRRVYDLIVLARQVVRCLRSLKRFRGRPVSSHRECEKLAVDLTRDWNLPNLWLEYQYGWRQIVSDIYGMIEALQKFEGSSFQRYRVKGRARTARFYSDIVDVGFGMAGAWPSAVPVLRTITRNGRYFWKIRIDCVLKDDIYRTMSDVGIFDPQLVAWELLPYSFVVDWLIRVGQYLDAINAYQGLEFSSATTTVGGGFAWSTRNVLRTDLSPCGKYQEISAPKTVASGFRRSVSSTPPQARLALDYTPLSLERLISGIALLGQILGVTPRRWWY
jgi:hypothetical protein